MAKGWTLLTWQPFSTSSSMNSTFPAIFFFSSFSFFNTCRLTLCVLCIFQIYRAGTIKFLDDISYSIKRQYFINYFNQTIFLNQKHRLLVRVHLLLHNFPNFITFSACLHFHVSLVIMLWQYLKKIVIMIVSSNLTAQISYDNIIYKTSHL